MNVSSALFEALESLRAGNNEDALRFVQEALQAFRRFEQHVQSPEWRTITSKEIDRVYDEITDIILLVDRKEFASLFTHAKERRDGLFEFAKWLADMADPESEDRRNVTLNMIIQFAQEALET